MGYHSCRLGGKKAVLKAFGWGVVPEIAGTGIERPATAVPLPPLRSKKEAAGLLAAPDFKILPARAAPAMVVSADPGRAGTAEAPISAAGGFMNG